MVGLPLRQFGVRCIEEMLKLGQTQPSVSPPPTPETEDWAYFDQLARRGLNTFPITIEQQPRILTPLK